MFRVRREGKNHFREKLAISHDVAAVFYCRGKGIETVRRGAVKFRLYENEEIAAAFALEQVISVDTAAVGGNAGLIAMGE